MGARQSSQIVWMKNRGQNEWDAAVDVPIDQSVASRNVHLNDGGIGTRRGGSSAVTITGVTAPVKAAAEYIPGQDETAAEMFVVDSSATTKILRCAAGSTFSNLTLTDNVSSEPHTVSFATLNGKLYIAHDSTVNRLHVFDPGLSTTTVRRAGMGTPAAPTGADDAAGGLTLTRSYKVAYTEQRSSVTVRRSELSPVLTRSIVAKAGSTITKPSGISEGETHWELYASDTATGTYYLIATTVVGTTTFDDTSATIPTTTAQDTIGSNTPWPSVKSIGTDGSRLYGLGVWETSAGDSVTPKAGRFYFGPVQDSSSRNDDERINNTTTLKGYIDLSRNAGGVDRGVTPKPVNNVIYAFQSAGVYALYPTDSDATPFRRVVLDGTIGNMSQQAIVMARDKAGVPCVFFVDQIKGPYVVGGSQGLKWCGKDLAVTWALVNRDATLPAFGVWFPDLDQVWFGVATSGNLSPNLILVLDVTELNEDEDGDLRGGWTIYDGDLAAAWCGVLFSGSLGIQRSRLKLPYIGAASKLLRYNALVNQDDSVSFRAYVQSGALAISTETMQLERSYVMADASLNASITHRLIRNVGAENIDSTLSLTAAGSETIVFRKAEDATLQDAWTVQALIGELAAANQMWHIHQWRGTLLPGANL